MLAAGRDKYDNGDKMGALKLFEAALSKDPTPFQKQDALYGATCVHASFGDLEIAKLPLRDAVQSGLDFDAALNDPSRIRLVTSQQVLIQLRKFADAARRQALSKGDSLTLPREVVAAAAARPISRRGSVGPSSAKALLTEDMGDVLQTDINDMDSSVWGIVRRVALLLLTLVGGGIALFYLGLEYAFPK